ncbi:nucleotidyltransferase domain-containing protein [Candidatus Bathyarchaeota archaeon]|nr:nucleotidyltransferase domain-containing protein [Candidatus Bathyarchaeota archaeon]
MSDPFKLAEAFIDHAVEKHGDEIAVIFYYGSYATGTAGADSDLDLVYVPDDVEATASLYTSFVHRGVGYEFWPMSWSRLERIASADEHWPVAAAIIAYGRVLWHRSEADLARFNALKEKVERLRVPESRHLMVGKALDAYKEVLNDLGRLRLEVGGSDVSGARWLAVSVMISCLECLGLANQTYFRKGWGSNHDEVLALKDRPRRLAEYVEALVSKTDLEKLLDAAEGLARDTREVLLGTQRETASPTGIRNELVDYYPGIKEYVNKVKTAALRGDAVKAVVSAGMIQDELTRMLCRGAEGIDHHGFNLPSELRQAYNGRGFPDLMAAEPTPGALLEAAGKLDEAARRLFSEAGLSLDAVEDVEDLKRLIEERDT